MIPKKVIAFALCVVFLAALSGRCQTISPLTQEFSAKHASGTFTVSNMGLIPLAVVIQTEHVAPDGAGRLRALPANGSSDVQLSQTSMRLGPKQSEEVSYKVVSCDAMPCAIRFWAVFSGLHTQNGFAVVMRINSNAYVCEKRMKAGKCRESILHPSQP